MEVAMPSELPSNEYYTLLHTGDRPAMELKPYPANALVENVIFESENPEIVTVTEDGVLEAHKVGITFIQIQKMRWRNLLQGYKTLEVDLSLTADGEVVCRHTWYSDDFEVSNDGEVPDLETFEREKYFGTLTPLSGKELLEIWAENPELYFMTDVKQDENTDLLEVVERLVELAKETGHEELLGHLIIQAYSIEDYDKVNQIYPFDNWLFTIYQLPEEIEASMEAAAFAGEHEFGFFVPNELKRNGVK